MHLAWLWMGFLKSFIRFILILTPSPWLKTSGNVWPSLDDRTGALTKVRLKTPLNSLLTKYSMNSSTFSVALVRRD